MCGEHMSNFVNLPLPTLTGNNLYLNAEYLKAYEEELLAFLDGQDYMHNLRFAKSIIMNQELKANNAIEGINDDLTLIADVIKHRSAGPSDLERQRIINLYRGYQYILKGKPIDKDHLKELYDILSAGLLDGYCRSNMGSLYRTQPVYILRGQSLIDPFMGADADKIDYYMDQFFDFANSPIYENREIDIFIKSQIMHFYFVYIHPYFDVNGRTSRTVAMWYLINHQNYPYIVFNRAISFAKREYELNIIKGRTHGDITLFLKYLLVVVERELEKEFLIRHIGLSSPSPLSREEKQMIEYFLTMHSNKTIKDLIHTYNQYNEKRQAMVIYEEKIKPLIDKKILLVKGPTNGHLCNNQNNQYLGINPKLVAVEPQKVKHLSLTDYL